MDENQALEAINAVLPASGEVTYDAVYQQLQAAGKVDAARQFHKLRRSGKLAARTERVDGRLVMYVSRQSA